MRNPFRTALYLGIDEVAITLVDERRGRARPALFQVAWPAHDAAAVVLYAQQLAELFKEAKVHGARMHIVLADALVRYFTVIPPANIADFRDCEAAAAMRFAALFDEAPARWEIQADWHLTQPFLACAVPRALKACLEQSARAANVTLMGVAPQYVSAWNRWRRQLTADSWLVLAHGAQLSLGVAIAGELKSVKRLASTGSDDDALTFLPGLLAREALSLGRDLPARVAIIAPLAGQWSAADAEAAGLHRLDKTLSGDVPEPMRDGVALARTGCRP